MLVCGSSRVISYSLPPPPRGKHYSTGIDVQLHILANVAAATEYKKEVFPAFGRKRCELYGY